MDSTTDRPKAPPNPAVKRIWKLASGIVVVALAALPLPAQESVHLFSLEFVEMKGRAGHEGYFPLQGDPPVGQATVLARLLGPWTEAALRLEAEDGSLLEEIPLEPPGNSTSRRVELLASISVPDQPFRLGVTGVDAEGDAFDLPQERLFRPATVELRFRDALVEAAPGMVVLPTTLINHGAAESFGVTLENDGGFTMASDVTLLTVGAGASQDFEILLTVPVLPWSVNILVSATVVAVSNTDNRHRATTTVEIENFSLTFLDGFESGDTSAWSASHG